MHEYQKYSFDYKMHPIFKDIEKRIQTWTVQKKKSRSNLTVIPNKNHSHKLTETLKLTLKSSFHRHQIFAR